MSRKSLTEDGTLGKVTEAKSDGSYKIQVITPGQGASGYYSAEVLEAAAKAKVWGKGTKVFFDHPTATEDEERPARSVKDLAAVLTEDATWDGSALVARIKPTGGLGKTVLENDTFRQAVGVSVRASAEGDVGEVAGKQCWIVSEIFPGTFNSVDLVTYAGRGGMILESAREEAEADKPTRTIELTREAALKQLREARNVGQWMESRIHLGFTQVADEMFGDGKLTREERIAMSSGIGAALAAFTASVEASAPQLYARDLWAEPEALTAVAEAATPIVPVHPAGSHPTKEHIMPEIEEARMRELEEAHGRVPTLEAKVTGLEAELSTTQRELAVEKARGYARDFGSKRVREANGVLPAAVVDKIVAEAMRDIPLGEDNRLDAIAFGTSVDEARNAEETYLAQIVENGNGRVRGVGSTDSTAEVTEAHVDNIVAGAFGRRTVQGA
jgi:polyhydroxyalkanoate synthesis regulator phasin